MYSYNLQHDASYISNFFGTNGGTKSDEFSEMFQRWGDGGGSKAVWNFSKNSSDLVALSVLIHSK